MILKQSKLASVGEVPYNMLVIVLQFFWLFLFFSLKSIDRHKNPGNATKEKTNVQPRSKNPELRRRRGTGLLGVWEGAGRVVPAGQPAVETQEGDEAAGQVGGYVNRCTMTALSRLASFRVWLSSASSLFGKVVMRTKLVAAMAGRASTMKSRMSLILVERGRVGRWVSRALLCCPQPLAILLHRAAKTLTWKHIRSRHSLA